MIRFHIKELLAALNDLEVNERELTDVLDNPPKSQSDYVKFSMRQHVAALETIERFSDELALIETKGRCQRFKSRLDFVLNLYSDLGLSLSTITSVEINTETQGILHAIEKELGQRMFAFIPTEKEKFFEHEKLFGDVVFDVFPEARGDIKELGNCLASDSHTGAAFYSMRIVEIGLRELARSLNVRLKKTPIDYAGWESVVKAIDDKLAAKIPKSRGPKKTAALKFKQDLLADFKSFEVARNEIMHCRWRCNEPEAEGMYIRVREFMQRLATAFSKNKTIKRKSLQQLFNPNIAIKSFTEMFSTIGDFSDPSKLSKILKPPEK